MEALPAGPAPAPRRQLIVGASLASVAIVMLAGGMLGVWALKRTEATDAGLSWVPDGVTIPEVPSNVMLIAFVGVCVFAQWAVWSSRRDDRGHTIFALACTAFVALLIINAQAFVYSQMGMPINEGEYAPLFYAITGTFIALMIVGIVFTTVATFRYLAGRTREREILVAHAIYWYTIAGVFAAIWFVVYVTK